MLAYVASVQHESSDHYAEAIIPSLIHMIFQVGVPFVLICLKRHKLIQLHIFMVLLIHSRVTLHKKQMKDICVCVNVCRCVSVGAGAEGAGAGAGEQVQVCISASAAHTYTLSSSKKFVSAALSSSVGNTSKNASSNTFFVYLFFPSSVSSPDDCKLIPPSVSKSKLNPPMPTGNFTYLLLTPSPLFPVLSNLPVAQCSLLVAFTVNKLTALTRNP